MAITQVLLTIPGVFYQRPSPDAPPFKTPGDPVAVGETVGLVEVMKSFLPVEAEVAGTFRGYLVDDQAEAEPGAAACEIET